MKSKKSENVTLDIDKISQECYDKILEAFEEQFGYGNIVYDNWKITATKEVV